MFPKQTKALQHCREIKAVVLCSNKVYEFKDLHFIHRHQKYYTKIKNSMFGIKYSS